MVDFLPVAVKNRIEQRKKEIARAKRPDNRRGHVDLDPMPSLTVAEWEAANLRLLTHLLRTGELARDHVDYYIAYSVQIMEFLNVYDWPSIVAFDDRYRDLQAYHKFAWGDMRMSNQLGILKPRHMQQKPRNATTITADSAIPDCKQWLNSGRTRCEYGARCKFAHRPAATTTTTKND